MATFRPFIELVKPLRPFPGLACSIPRRESCSSNSRPRDDNCLSTSRRSFNRASTSNLERLAFAILTSGFRQQRLARLPVQCNDVIITRASSVHFLRLLSGGHLTPHKLLRLNEVGSTGVLGFKERLLSPNPLST